MKKILLILILLPLFSYAQIIPKGYEHMKSSYVDGKIQDWSVFLVADDNDSKYMIVKTGYKPTIHYIFDYNSLELINKVTVPEYTSYIDFSHNNQFYTSYIGGRRAYSYNISQSIATKVSKSEFKYRKNSIEGTRNAQLMKSPHISNDRNNIIIWNYDTIQLYSNVGENVNSSTIVKKEDDISITKENPSQFYALILGVNDYNDNKIKDLDNPINDANNFYNVLINNYTYKKENVKLIENATKDDLLEELDNYSKKLNDNDNFILFYAGHGYWDEKFNEGYWFLADSKQDSRRTWVSNGTIQEYMRGISAKNVLLIADACFAGSMFKTRDVEIKSIMAVKKLFDLPSRKAMTSGNMSEVPDNSVFIKFLIKRLEENTNRYLTSEQLFSKLKIAVINNSTNSQIPQFGVINGTGDEGGGFLFIKKD